MAADPRNNKAINMKQKIKKPIYRLQVTGDLIEMDIQVTGDPKLKKELRGIAKIKKAATVWDVYMTKPSLSQKWRGVKPRPYKRPAKKQPTVSVMITRVQEAQAG
jgi:hypothetical protein